MAFVTRSLELEIWIFKWALLSLLTLPTSSFFTVKSKDLYFSKIFSFYYVSHFNETFRVQLRTWPLGLSFVRSKISITQRVCSACQFIPLPFSVLFVVWFIDMMPGTLGNIGYSTDCLSSVLVCVCVCVLFFLCPQCECPHRWHTNNLFNGSVKN